MKTNRWFRIFMMALDTLVLAFLRLFRRFTHLQQFPFAPEPGGPHALPQTKKEVLGIAPELEVNGERVQTYERKHPIFFPEEERYGPENAIVTFRGNLHRSGGSVGTPALQQRKMEICWQKETGKLKKHYGKGFWTGSGWTGQPLIVSWPKETRQCMNLFPEKKEKELTEVIYSTMDGNVYFLDLEDGTETRPPISVGMPFKGAGAVDPRGIPLLYLGPGDGGPNPGEEARCLVYSLIDGKRLHEFGKEDPFSLRVFHGYDSSPLVHAETDTLIEPGENGILYTLHLGTEYDAKTGKLSLSPGEMVKLRYRTARSTEARFWQGMEDSAAVWKNFLYIADNGGNLLCIDLNTMAVVWAADVEDDTNGSPVLELENGHPFLYIATSLHWQAGKLLKLGDVPIFKFDAITGKCIWRRTYFCNTVAGVSGGVQATCLSGKGEIADLLIVPVARTPMVRSGLLVALDKQTGKEVWRRSMKRYAWSSPVAVYDQAGRANLVLGDSQGRLSLIDGKTGALLDELQLGANIEATPAVFGDTLVVGTRGQKIFGIRLQ